MFSDLTINLKGKRTYATRMRVVGKRSIMLNATATSTNFPVTVFDGMYALIFIVEILGQRPISLIYAPAPATCKSKLSYSSVLILF